MNDNLPSDCHQSMPSDLEEVKIWKDRTFQIFLLHTGKGQTDLHKLVRNVILAGGNPELTIRAARIIRQYLFRHVHYADRALRFACYYLSPPPQ